MATQQDLDYTYTTIDRIFRLSMGETGDFSGAKYDGDFNISLEEAQHRKHKYICDQLNITQGSRVIDLGCGWGPFLNFAQNKKGAECIGITLSQGQAAACKKNGFNVHIRDCRKISPDDFGKFDAAVSIGAFEHFCSVEDYKNGRQEELYRDFFKSVADLLPDSGRFFLQTMVFGKNMLPLERFNIHADKSSDEYILALMEKQFPGSWLPYGSEMVTKCAAPYFEVKDINSGRIDYIETIRQWRRRFRKFNPQKYWLYLSLTPQYFTNPDFRHRVNIFRLNPNKICFERELFDHYRIVFEKK